MKTMTVQSAGNIPAGTKVWLTGDQASARMHLLNADDPKEFEKAQADLDRAKMLLTKARLNRDPEAIDKAEKVQQKAREKLNERRLYVTNAQTGFKAGEEIAIQGKLDRGLEQLFGVAPQAASVAPKAVTETPKTATDATGG